MQRATSLFLLFLILQSVPAQALSTSASLQAANPPGGSPPNPGSQSPALPSAGTPTGSLPRAGTVEKTVNHPDSAIANSAPQYAQFQCILNSNDPGWGGQGIPGPRTYLDPRQANRFLDSTAKDGFLGNQINNPDNAPDGPVKKLDNNIAVIPTGDGKEALLRNVPSVKFKPSQMQQWLNQRQSGEFAFGASLYDSVRIGKCLTEGGVGCATRDQTLLSHRYSGAGIIADFKLAASDVSLSELFSGWMSNDQPIDNLSADQSQELKGSILAQGVENVEVKRLEFVPKLMKNVIETKAFTSKVQSNCSASNCLISTYSAFDKHFNSWFSATMVVSNVGPAMFGITRKFFIQAAHKSWMPNLSDSAVMKYVRRNFTGPDTWLGNKFAHEVSTELQAAGMGDFRQALIEATGEWDSGYKALKGGSMRKFIDELASEGGRLDKMTPHQRGEFMKAVQKMRAWFKGMKEQIKLDQDIYDNVVKTYGRDTPQEIAARIQFGRNNASRMLRYDSEWSLDFPEWFAKQETNQLYKYGLRNTETNEVFPVTADSANFQKILQKFSDDGDFASWVGQRGNKIYEVDPLGRLQYYKIGKGQFVKNIGIDDLAKYVDPREQHMAVLTDGTEILIDPNTVPFIQANATGSVPIYKVKGWEKAMTEGPEEFSRRMTMFREATGKLQSPAGNLDNLWNVLVEKDFYGADRHYFSWLDKQFAADSRLFRNYFTGPGALKYTLYPLAYWQAKQGVGLEQLSGYQLPDTWREIEISPDGAHPVYRDAFVDYFANEGSDEGDIFRQVVNKMPWKWVLNEAWENFLPMEEQYAWLTGEGIRGENQESAQKGSVTRTDVENIAFLTATPDQCEGCSTNLSSNAPGMTSGDELLFQLQVPGTLKAHILEDIQSDDAKDKGSTLIAFAHHANLNGHQVNNGKESPEQGEGVDLSRARDNKETCKDKVAEMPFLGYTSDNPRLTGLILSGTEALGYAFFSYGGVFGSVLQQMVIAPALQDCVDDVEGYYVHLFVPGQHAQEGRKTSQRVSSEKVTQSLSDSIRNVTGKTNAKGENELEEEEIISPTDNPFEKFQKEVKNQAIRLNQKAKVDTILQSNVFMQVKSEGSLYSQEILFYWFKGNSVPNAYDTNTVTIVSDGNKAVTFDKPNGKLLVNGQPVIENPDLVRLSMLNGAIPAYEIPQRIGVIGLPNSTELVFETQMDSPGELFVRHPSVMDCIRKSVFEQTGVQLNSPDGVMEAFGDLQNISTSTHPQVQIDYPTQTILAEGAPRATLSGPLARVQVQANGGVFLNQGSGTQATSIGRLNGIQFANGTITFKPAPGGGGELLVWLRHHEKAVLSQGDVQDLKAKPTTVTNPETGCEEPALDLEAVPVQGSDLAKFKVDNFNASMDKMGPFQVFDTPTKRYVFYSKKEGDACVPYFKVIDKATGQVLVDQPITSPIEQTPTGVKFQTADGKTHTLDFSAENGVPRVAYNGGVPEVLQSAQGPNGSFYYDPNKGQWYPENAQLLPLNDAFRQQGFLTTAGPNGNTATIPGGSPVNVNVGTGSGNSSPFNLPSLPEDPVVFLLVLGLLAAGFVLIQRRFETHAV